MGDLQAFRGDVFDKARCHFMFDIISVEMARLLNAERISNAAFNPPTVLKWAHYKHLCLSRIKGTKESEDLMDHLLKVREEGLPVYLWIAERRSERDLLVKDGVQLPERLWLSYVLHFVTNDERLVLQVPAE